MKKNLTEKGESRSGSPKGRAGARVQNGTVDSCRRMLSCEQQMKCCEQKAKHPQAEKGAKLVSSYVKAGFASIMDDKIEKRMSLDTLFDINSPSTFIFRVSGDSMSDIGIFDRDYVIIKKTPEASIGDVVLAVVDNEFTLKTYKKDSKGYYLQPENQDYPIIRPKVSLTIFGVALGIARKIK